MRREELSQTLPQLRIFYRYEYSKRRSKQCVDSSPMGMGWIAPNGFFPGLANIDWRALARRRGLRWAFKGSSIVGITNGLRMANKAGFNQ